MKHYQMKMMFIRTSLKPLILTLMKRRPNGKKGKVLKYLMRNLTPIDMWYHDR